MLLAYSSGNNAANLHFVWKLPPSKPLEETFQHSFKVTEKIKPLLPQYHTRAMHCAMWWYLLHVEEIRLFSSRKMVDFAGWRYAYASLELHDYQVHQVCT